MTLIGKGDIDWEYFSKYILDQKKKSRNAFRTSVFYRGSVLYICTFHFDNLKSNKNIYIAFKVLICPSMSCSNLCHAPYLSNCISSMLCCCVCPASILRCVIRKTRKQYHMFYPKLYKAGVIRLGALLDENGKIMEFKSFSLY